MRIIETEYPIGTRTFPVYVFCLAQSQLDSSADIVAALIEPGLRIGVYQLVRDKAGILIYVDEQQADRHSCINEVVKVINRVLGTDYAIMVDDTGSSCLYVATYGTWPGATTYEELKENPAFVLPYMAE